MKYMGSKRAMLQNGLGELLGREVCGAPRFVDLFSGSGAVAIHVATNFPVPVVAFDIQSYSAVLAGAVLERAQTNQQAREIIERIERTLQKVVLDELRQNFGGDENQWWIQGVPKTVRVEVANRLEEDNGKRGGRENYFDLIHYRKIIADNWELFQTWLAYGKKGVGKDKGTAWIGDVNERRKVVAHASAGVTLAVEDVSELQQYDSWLAGQVSGTESTEGSGDSDLGA